MGVNATVNPPVFAAGYMPPKQYCCRLSTIIA